MKANFISGHLNLTQEEFNAHYLPLIYMAVANGDSFVVGDARGADTMAQDYLYKWIGKSRVTVYHMFDKPRYNAGFQTVGGFQTDKERDEVMTANSTNDIAWVRQGRHRSGTQKNLDRRSIHD